MKAPNNTIRGLTINRFFELFGVNHGYQIYIDITSGNNRIEGNLINTNNQGTAAAPNPQDFLQSGIFLQNSPDNIIGGTTPAARNVISGTKQKGIDLNGVGCKRNLIQGNFIGTDITGQVKVPNGFHGIDIAASQNTVGGTVPGARNIISNNGPFGININGDGRDANLIQGNFVGTDVTGTVAMPNRLSGIILAAVRDTTVGGTSPNARNVFSGHSQYGIEVSASGRSGLIIQGNFIGTNGTGTQAIPNNQAGINLGNTQNSLVADNLISGNAGHGILLFGIGIPASRRTQITRNKIGTDATGTGPLGNAKVGVFVDGTGGALIGSTDGTPGNTIAFNGHAGVMIALGWNDEIQQNSIFSNSGLGIDVLPQGCNYLLGCFGTVVPNDSCDSDNGGNRLQNFPVINAAGAASSGSGTVVQGTFNSSPNQLYVLNFFANDSCDPSGFGEGKTFIGSALVTTGDSCNASFNLLLPANVPAGSLITATATNGEGDTSSFSKCTPVAGTLATPSPTPTPALIQFSAPTFDVNEGSPHATITVTRTGDLSIVSTVDYATSEFISFPNCGGGTGQASLRCDYVAGGGTLQFAANETSKTISIPIIDDVFAEGNEFFDIVLNNPAGCMVNPVAKLASVKILDNDLTTGTTPISQTSFFVNQHYLDFLGREPDSAGFEFWKNEIDSCGSQSQCIEIKRINVSAAFFLSIEFTETGYLVERLYKAAYGDATGTSFRTGSLQQIPVPIIRINEFFADSQKIGQGVVVGQTGWEQALENNKQSFVQSFVQRSRFTSLYPGSMTATQFVTALNTNAGNPLSQDEQSQLIQDLTNGTRTRAQVLRAVAEDRDLINSEFNRAFVLMQYFGYLRRDPDASPDNNHSGYDFWLTKLNQFNGNFVEAEMVKAFITSSEYRFRFGF